MALQHDVDEIGGPRASMRVLSHMTAWWRDAGIWDRYKADFEERFSEKPHTVRPSPLGMEHYADVYVGQRAKQYIENYDLNQPLVLLGEFWWAPRAVGCARTLCEHARPTAHAFAAGCSDQRSGTSLWPTRSQISS